MGGQYHVRRLVPQGTVDHVGIEPRQRLRVVAALPRCLPFLFGTQIRPHGVIELQVAATGGVKRLHRLAISLCRIGEELLHIGVNLAADRGPATSKVQDRGRWNGHLCGRTGNLVEKPEVLQHVVLVEPHPAGNDNPFRLGLHAVKLDTLLTLGQFDAGQSGQVIKVPPGAPELTVGHGLETHGFLPRHGLANALVFGFPQRLRIDSALLKIGAGRLQTRRPQQAAYLVGAMRKGQYHRRGSPVGLSEDTSIVWSQST